MHSTPRYQRHFNLKQKQKKGSRKPDDREDDSEDTYSSLLRAMGSGKNDDDDASADEIDTNASSEDGELDEDEEATLIDAIFDSPEHNKTHILQSLRNAFADASRGVRQDVVLALYPVLRRARSTRPAPGRAFITGLLGFDDVCKRFEKSLYQNDELNRAYSKIEVELGELLERLQAANSRLEQKRAAFHKQVKEQTNKMREIIDTLPEDMDALLEKLERKVMDMGMDDSEANATKTKRRERTKEGALAELRL
ncbi:hypothetical protein BC827DRAFT_1271861 [Russula dissimulans]|nr:hypothetical protein BC827DRAFT_1271861 [Russula dissimulans]